jgi:hypothetical protein
MPNSETFSIPQIGDFVNRYLSDSEVSIDPFARNKRWATYTNDLNPETAAEHHLEAEVFLQMLVDRGVRADLVILDPPYSPRQVRDCYQGIGLSVSMQDTQVCAARKRRRALVDRLVVIGGVVLHFGWDSNGMGVDDWQIEEIMLVAHGSANHDTICMAQRRIR